MLLVQQLLRSGTSLEELKTTHGINYNITNNKICLNYDQINASESDPVACQCRGLILRVDTFDVVACPMFRFFNMGQGNAAVVDFNSALVEEKMDGSCIVVYWDQEQNIWCSGTRSRSEANVPIDDSGKTFSDLVNIACSKMSQNKTDTLQDFMQNISSGNKDPKQYTFVFELTSPLNRIVCSYNNFKLTLLAVRNNTTLQEEDPKLWSSPKYNLETPKLYHFNNINHLIQIIREWNPLVHEGVVLKDTNFNRIKVKNPSYLALNHMRDSLMKSIRGCIEIILLEKDDDIISIVPEFVKKKIEYIKPVIRKVFTTTAEDFERLNPITDMKSFALEANQCLWPGALFALKRGKTTDLKTFSLGNHPDKAKISAPAVNTMFELCKKIDPKVGNLEVELSSND